MVRLLSCFHSMDSFQPLPVDLDFDEKFEQLRAKCVAAEHTVQLVQNIMEWDSDVRADELEKSAGNIALALQVVIAHYDDSDGLEEAVSTLHAAMLEQLALAETIRKETEAVSKSLEQARSAYLTAQREWTIFAASQ